MSALPLAGVGTGKTPSLWPGLRVWNGEASIPGWNKVRRTKIISWMRDFVGWDCVSS